MAQEISAQWTQPWSQGRHLNVPLIVLEGLDGSGKSVRGRRLAEYFGVDFVEFPRPDVPRVPGLAFEEACFQDRLSALTEIPNTYIAGRWSPSGIAYSSDRAAARAREALVPQGSFHVFVDTPRNVRAARLAERVAGDLFEIPEIQIHAEAGYRELLSGGWNPLIVRGVDVEEDIQEILAAFQERML